MKNYTIIKIGYSAGVYGCSNEYFTTIITNSSGKNKGMLSISFYGMYGAEERISAELRKRGYNQHYTQSFFGKMTKRDLTNNCVSEYEAINWIVRTKL